MSDANTTLGEALARALDDQASRLSQAWRRAAAGDVRALRRARIASRRLREALSIAEAVVPPRPVKRIRRDVRRVTQALGPMREIDVTIEKFDAATRRHVWPASRVSPVRRRLDRERQKRREKVVSWMNEVDPADLRRRLSGIRSRLHAADPSALRQALVVRVLQRSRDVRQAVRRSGTLYAPERLHEVRIAIKKLRYALEIAESVGRMPLALVIQALTRRQKRLGELHDVEMLLGEVQTLAAGPGVAARASGEVVGDALERDCRALHARVVAGMSELDRTLDDVRRLVADVPLSEGQRLSALPVDVDPEAPVVMARKPRARAS